MEKEINDYLRSLLTNIESYSLNPGEQKKVKRDKATFILEKIMRKKFRRKVSEDTRKSIEEKVRAEVKDNQPIHFTIPFGGYKHFWNPSHPNPDWAELFHFRSMTDYVLPILAAHKPGVIIEYISEDLILPRMNNYPDSAIEAYTASFRQLLEWYSQFTPKGLGFRFFRVSERCDKDAIISDVEKLIPERKAAFQKLSANEQEREIHRSLRSVYWNGDKDLTMLSDAEKRDRIVESRLIELAFYDVEGKPEHMSTYYWDDNHIAVCFSFGLSPDNDAYGDLTIATSYGSIVDYWIGRGVLQNHNGKLHPTIISQQQYGSSKSNLQLVSISPGLLPLENFKNIEVLSI